MTVNEKFVANLFLLATFWQFWRHL